MNTNSTIIAPFSPTLEARRAQAFPVLAADEIARMHRFGKPRLFASGERVLEAGKVSPGIYLVLSGAIRVTGRDTHGHELPVVEHGPGGFSGELSQLSDKPSFVDALAVGETQTLEISAENLQALLVAEAVLGEKLMRAMILRRVALIESGAGGPVLVGAASAPDVARLRSFLTRNGIPHQLLDPATDSDAQAFIADCIWGEFDPTPESCTWLPENVGSGKVGRPWARMHAAQVNHACCWAGESCRPVDSHGDGRALHDCSAAWNAAERGSIPMVLYP